jgi:hypothetical protein
MKRITRRILKGIGWLLAIVLVSSALWVGIDALNVHTLKLKASSIQKEVTIDTVIALMGEPHATHPKGSGLFTKSEHKTLAYGSAFEWDTAFSKEPPFFFPFTLRLFGPSRDDILVVMDDQDRVLEVKIPGR